MGAARQPFELQSAVERILDKVSEKRVRQSSAAPVLLGISGIDCSGKSTLAKAVLEHALEVSLEAELVNLDDFIIPGALRKNQGPPAINYFENTFDRTAFTKHLKMVASIPGIELVIGEGVFLFRRETVGLWDLRIWIEMSTEQSLSRGSVRDGEFFGSQEQAANEYRIRFIPAYEQHLNRDRPAEAAELVFDVI